MYSPLNCRSHRLVGWFSYLLYNNTVFRNQDSEVGDTPGKQRSSLPARYALYVYTDRAVER